MTQGAFDAIEDLRGDESPPGDRQKEHLMKQGSRAARSGKAFDPDADPNWQYGYRTAQGALAAGSGRMFDPYQDFHWQLGFRITQMQKPHDEMLA